MHFGTGPDAILVLRDHQEAGRGQKCRRAELQPEMPRPDQLFQEFARPIVGNHREGAIGRRLVQQNRGNGGTERVNEIDLLLGECRRSANQGHSADHVRPHHQGHRKDIRIVQGMRQRGLCDEHEGAAPRPRRHERGRLVGGFIACGLERLGKAGLAIEQGGLAERNETHAFAPVLAHGPVGAAEAMRQDPDERARRIHMSPLRNDRLDRLNQECGLVAEARALLLHRPAHKGFHPAGAPLDVPDHPACRERILRHGLDEDDPVKIPGEDQREAEKGPLGGRLLVAVCDAL